MCNVAVLEFFIENIEREEFENKRVLEVGSKYVNGSVRPLIERFCSPREYLGIDIEPGKFVDLVLPAEKIVEFFGPESFDVIITTEVLEHVQDWRLVVNNMKTVLKRGGYIYITTRSFGFPLHSYPYDFWRYEIEDMQRIFSDFEILKLIRDHEAPGVFLKAKKPFNYRQNDLQGISLYSMILNMRTASIPNLEEIPKPEEPSDRRILKKLRNFLSCCLRTVMAPLYCLRSE
jgi:SAM-dependent methyltransferase